MEAISIVCLMRRCDYVPVHLYGRLVSTVPYGRADAQTVHRCVMEVIRHAELIVWNGSFGQLSTPTVHLIIQSNVSPITGFVRHTLYGQIITGFYANQLATPVLVSQPL